MLTASLNGFIEVRAQLSRIPQFHDIALRKIHALADWA